MFVAKQQQVLNFLLNSLSKEMLEYVAAYTTPHEVWDTMISMAATQSRARVINTRMALSTTRKGNVLIAQYVGKMKVLADDMASAGKKLDDEDLVSYILTGLDSDFDSVISAVAAHAEPITVPELYSQLIGYEQRQELHGRDYSTANAVTRGRGSPLVHGSFTRGRGRGSGRNFDNNGGGYHGSNNHVECQLCGKKGHTIQRCFKRFDRAFTGEEKSASSTVASYDIDTNWYVDSRAIDHITGELDKLTARDKYLGNDQVHTASGSDMSIDQIGHSIIHTSTHDLSLNNILYVPQANRNLVSVHHFTRDNHVFLEHHPWHFFIKDQATRRTLHHGKVEGGLYPLKSCHSLEK
jgi:hypothetical protein